MMIVFTISIQFNALFSSYDESSSFDFWSYSAIRFSTWFSIFNLLILKLTESPLLIIYWNLSSLSFSYSLRSLEIISLESRIVAVCIRLLRVSLCMKATLSTKSTINYWSFTPFSFIELIVPINDFWNYPLFFYLWTSRIGLYVSIMNFGLYSNRLRYVKLERRS